jgi:hypothetical protein
MIADFELPIPDAIGYNVLLIGYPLWLPKLTRPVVIIVLVIVPVYIYVDPESAAVMSAS